VAAGAARRRDGRDRCSIPWALTQPGFWLSFAAVGLLMASAMARPASGIPASEREPGWRGQWLRAARRGWRGPAHPARRDARPDAAHARLLPAGLARRPAREPGRHSGRHAAGDAAGAARHARLAAVAARQRRSAGARCPSGRARLAAGSGPRGPGRAALGADRRARRGRARDRTAALARPAARLAARPCPAAAAPASCRTRAASRY
jgi:hypothetical protein